MSSTLAMIYAARGLRGIGDGCAVIILPAYLSALGYDAWLIGLVASAALLGSALATLLVGLVAHAYAVRSLMLGGAALMTATGLAFPFGEHVLILAATAFVGTINPSSGDLGPLVPLEHAAIAQGAADKNRTRAFARYSLVGTFATALGSLGAAVPEFLVAGGWSEPAALRAIFYGYALLGLASAVVYWLIPALPREVGAEVPSALGPSRPIVLKLAALFSLDSFAGGFVAQSLLALWLFERFGMSLATAGLFFFWSGLLSALSYPVAAWLSRHWGLVNTMVFTHIPSSLCLIVAAFAPNLSTALVLLLIRSALSQMDVPTRTSYVMAVVTPPERPAAASFTAVPRSLAAALSPALSGALLNGAFLGAPLVLCGALKIVYDVALLFTFRHVKPPEEAGPA